MKSLLHHQKVNRVGGQYSQEAGGIPGGYGGVLGHRADHGKVVFVQVDLSSYHKAAARWRPERVRLLIVAESPPASLERYFYFERVRTADSLWVETMKALYGSEFGETRTERVRKAQWLSRFMADGCFLIDAVKEPFDRGCGDRGREARIRAAAGVLLEEIRSLRAERILVLKATVWRGVGERLKEAGLPILNRGPIPFPGSGQQERFRKEVKAIGLREFVQRVRGPVNGPT